jgi:hypothetical protein
MPVCKESKGAEKGTLLKPNCQNIPSLSTFRHLLKVETFLCSFAFQTYLMDWQDWFHDPAGNRHPDWSEISKERSKSKWSQKEASVNN